MEKRTFKDKVYQELAKTVKALSNPHRLEILELLAQGHFSVEEVANETDLSTANASQHLQVMKRVQLVSTQRDGNFVYYSLADKNVYKAWTALRDLGIDRMAEIQRLVQNFRDSNHSLKSLSSSELVSKMKEEDITIIDVRPKNEFEEGHIASAINIPADDLSEKLKELPKDKEVVAYCRGPFCVFADEAVKLLNKKGYTAKRLDDGFPEWKLKGRPVESDK